jgi:hypothetical protein
VAVLYRSLTDQVVPLSGIHDCPEATHESRVVLQAHEKLIKALCLDGFALREMNRPGHLCTTFAAFHYISFLVAMATRAFQQSSMQTLTWSLLCPCVIIVAHGWCLLGVMKNH